MPTSSAYWAKSCPWSFTGTCPGSLNGGAGSKRLGAGWGQLLLSTFAEVLQLASNRLRQITVSVLLDILHDRFFYDFDALGYLGFLGRERGLGSKPSVIGLLHPNLFSHPALQLVTEFQAQDFSGLSL